MEFSPPALAKTVAATARNGGGTFHLPSLRPVHPRAGYAVACAGHERRLAAATFSPATLRRYLAEHARPAALLGAWCQGAWIVLDLCELVAERDAALRLGALRGQQAVFDFARGRDLPVSGAPNPPSLQVGAASCPRRDRGRQSPRREHAMSWRRILVAGRQVDVPEQTTAEEIRARAGLPAAGGQRVLVRYQPSSGESALVGAGVPVDVEAGDAFDDVPVGTYGAVE